MPNCMSFLVTEAKRKHVRRRARFGQHRDVSYHQVFFYCYFARHGTEGNSRHSDRNIWGTCTIICHRQKLGDFSTCDAPRPGRPKTVTTPGIIDQI